MANFNRVILIGRLCADPELKQTEGGASVTHFTIAVNRIAKTGNTSNADFFEVEEWDECAEFVCKNFRKGDHILIEGELRTRKFETKSGEKVVKTYIYCKHNGFVDKKKMETAPEFSKEKMQVFEEKNASFQNDDLPF
jgi:single-strand DNA-binding protein